jgi:hypothetical protein
MTEEQAEALRRLAAVRKTSQAALLREALDHLVAEDERNQLLERARSIAGRYRSGHHSTSEHHDEALDEAFRV